MTSKLCGANTAGVTDLMNRFSKHHQHWDEFRWEEEIRKDERRISGYFHELGACLDLPDEEQLIYDQLAGRNDLVIADTPDSVRNIFSDEDDDAEVLERKLSDDLDNEDSFIIAKKQFSLLMEKLMNACKDSKVVEEIGEFFASISK